MIRFILLTVLIVMAAIVNGQAAINAYEFTDDTQRQRFHVLTAELRCPKCQNQAIADSDAPLAQDLRQRVYEMLQQGHSNGDIIDFMIKRYGDFITYRPPLKPSTWLLWFGPWLLLLGAFMSLLLWIRHRPPQPPELTDAEKQRLHNLLELSDKPKN